MTLSGTRPGLPADLDCAEVQAQLPLLVGGELEATTTDAAGGSLAELVRAHLTLCATCASELARLERALGALAALRAERLPEIDVWDGVRAELSRAGLLRPAVSGGQPAQAAALRADASSDGSGKRRIAPLRRWVAAAALLVGLGVAVIGMASRDPAREAPRLAERAIVPGPVATPGGAPLEPTLVAAPVAGAISAGGLQKVAPGQAHLWPSAQHFDVSSPARRSTGAWQAASFPVLQDPRVR